MTTKILAIDDSRTIRAMLSAALKRAGYLVATAVDGHDGLEKYQSEGPDVVITDVHMPQLDGLGFIEAMRQDPATQFVPILVFTSESSPALKERARLLGATGWINKPLHQASLFSILRRVTG